MALSLSRLKLDLPYVVRPRGGVRNTPTDWAFPALPARPARRQSRIRRGLAALLVAGVVLIAGTWSLIRVIPGFGPALADQLRAVIGSERVTELEELSAGVEDRIRLALGSEPRGMEELTPVELQRPIAPAPERSDPQAVPFRPADVGPMISSLKAANDGRWDAVAVEGGASAAVYRTLLHPDAERAYAELFVFALDLTALELHAVAGTIEPKGKTAAGGSGRVNESDVPRLVAAFNGGFKAEHGQFGMMVDGLELLPAKPGSCTVAQSANGTLHIANFRELESKGEQFIWWRQTPACMVEAGELHPGLRSGASRSWGATVDGDTVIRRSAIGLDAKGTTLYVAISNFTTARAIATGMKHAGAVHVAQLDVNHSFPKFLLYRHDAERERAVAIGAVKGFMYSEDDYLRTASTRDFFYVTRR